jgi:hypothetical protein
MPNVKSLQRFTALILLGVAVSAQAEYCVNWSSVVQKYSGETGHCWATEPECKSYYQSRSLTHPGDFGRSCYYQPGLHPPTGATHPGTSGSTKTATEQATAIKKYQAQKKAEESAQQRQFQHDQQQLLQELKGTHPSARTGLSLKAAPPVRTARQQLDCIQRESNSEAPPGGDWQNPKDCRPITPTVPDVPAPTAVDESVTAIPSNPVELRQFLLALDQRITTTRNTLQQQDKTVIQLEQEVAQEHSRQPLSNLKQAKKESDALRRAREALETATAARI